MLRNAIICTVAVVFGTALAARGAAKDDAESAAKKLADAKSYAWTAKTEGGFGGGSVDGKAEKEGFAVITLNFANNSLEAVKKGEKGAVKLEGEWKSFAELEEAAAGQPSREAFVARMMKNYKLPATLAKDLATKTKELKASGDALEGELTEDGAKDLLTFGGRGGADGPQVSNAKGSTKIWLKDGNVSKMEYRVQGTITFNGQDRDVDRTTTIEIKDVGTAKVQVPEEAKKKVS